MSAYGEGREAYLALARGQRGMYGAPGLRHSGRNPYGRLTADRLQWEWGFVHAADRAEIDREHNAHSLCSQTRHREARLWFDTVQECGVPHSGLLP